MSHTTLWRTWGLCIGLGLGSLAQAQNLSAYKTLATALEKAGRLAGQDPPGTLKQLDQAQAALEELAPTLTNQQLTEGLRTALGGARAAQARTPQELQAQVALARGLMRKALYDQTVNVLSSSPANSLDRLGLLASEFGLDTGSRQALNTDARAGQLNLIAWRLQKAGMAKVAAALSQVPEKPSPTSALSLARATGWFSAVQEAGRLISPPLDMEPFNETLAANGQNDAAAFQTQLANLKRSTASLGKVLATVPKAGSPAAAIPAIVTPVASAVPTTPQPAAQTKPAAQAGAQATVGGMPQAYASLSRALAAAGHGDPATARKYIAQVPAALASAPAGMRQTPGFERFLQDLNGAQKRKGLRAGDVQALISSLSGLEVRAAGRSGSTIDQLSAGVARNINPALRVILGLILAVLTFLPLHFLNLAFGGRNPYWQSIYWALLLLFMPSLLEGVFGTLGWIGDLAGVSALSALTNLTLNQGLYAQPLRWLLVAGAVALATYGFRGLCEQFGLLGTASKGKAKAPEAQQSLDWDEEV